MTIQDDIRDAKLQYNIKREAEKLLALSSGKIEKKWISYRWRNIIF